MRRYNTVIANTATGAAFLITAALVLAPYQSGTITPFYGFIGAPALLLAALAGAAWLRDRLIPKTSALASRELPEEVAPAAASVTRVAVTNVATTHTFETRPDQHDSVNGPCFRTTEPPRVA